MAECRWHGTGRGDWASSSNSAVFPGSVSTFSSLFLAVIEVGSLKIVVKSCMREGLFFSAPTCLAGGCGPRVGTGTRTVGHVPGQSPQLTSLVSEWVHWQDLWAHQPHTAKEKKLKYMQIWNCIQHSLMLLRDFYTYQAPSLLIWLYHLFSLTCWYGNL